MTLLIHFLDIDPPLINATSPVILNKADSIGFSCQAVAKPHPVKYTWLKDGKILSNTSTFTIASVDISDEGTYECVAGNTAGEKRKNVRMEVECKETRGVLWTLSNIYDGTVCKNN